jgi:transposase InsO family protein
LYKRLDRALTPRRQRRAELAERIRKSFVDSGGTCGSPRVVLDLRADGERVSVTPWPRSCRECLVARPRRRRHALTLLGKRCAARDLVRRNFHAVAPNVLWCGDLTEIATSAGKLHLACLLDMFSRHLVGHAFSEHHDAQLAVAAIQMATARRHGNVDGGKRVNAEGGSWNGRLQAQAEIERSHRRHLLSVIASREPAARHKAEE